MFPSRLLFILKISVLAMLRRIRYDFAREIVVGVSALVLGALFLYIFNDFINVKVLTLSASGSKVLARGATGVVFVLATVFLRKRLVAERFGEGPFCRFLEAHGEAPTVIRAFQAIRAIAMPIVVYGVCWTLTIRYFTQLPLSVMALIQVILLAGLYASLMINLGTKAAKREHGSLLSPAEIDKSTKGATLLRWRGRQLLWRNRSSRLSLLVATLFLALSLYCQLIAAPFLLSAAASLMIGIFIGAAMCIQVAEDLKCGWMEPFMGISHRMFVNTYYIIGALLAGVYGIADVLLPLLGALPAGASFLLQAFQLLALTAVAPLLTPSLLFQLDARRPVLTVFAGTLITLFIGTAIYVHPVSILILPIVIYYADDYQKNRFYTSYSQH
jgi:hypothetical protein